ncbi:aryl hydrocarbon receptor nuclear translocator-like protein 2 isoform X2 [Polypterus senegalus]|uniref:aryl hydrocarbon receptor nuclear translocator-like protein 2 isoform X2 n=1 Tax=Polypterus senegalus TaxID=55291 RepID=UPI001965C649|nr:aryl hydrocarbon receptor nuclear translocator-like protein 2 isoform X2 [Polypterus senegalus]
MSVGNAAAGIGETTIGETTEDQLVFGSQGPTTSFSSLISPPTAVVSSDLVKSMVEFPRKRKGSTDNQEIVDVDMEELQDKTDGEDQHTKMKCFREPHSQIEKRRRDKMNYLIDELSAIIPTCNPMSRKLDKLIVLRMAVQHLKSMKGAGSSFTEASYKPSFLPDDELKQLVLRAADGFLFVVGCDRGKILFVSESVSKVLNYGRAELIGQSLFDYVHPKDIAKVKEQLSASDVSPRERLIDAKTGLQVQTDIPLGTARLSSGARRSFFCRMKCNRVGMKSDDKECSQPNASKKKDARKYCTVHCTGYMKSWPATQVGIEVENDAEKESSNFSCLVAVGRLHPHIIPCDKGEIKVKPAEFVTRFAIDGKFAFVDQRATTILGYLPQELLGTSCYEYFHQDDLLHLADRHRKVLRSKEKIETNYYKFKTKYGSFVTLQSRWFSFTNPWTKEVEYIVSTNTVISSREFCETLPQSGDSKTSEESRNTHFPAIPGSSSGTVIGAGSIGTQIASELMDGNRLNSSPSSGNASPFSVVQDKSALSLVQTSNHVPNGESVHSGCSAKPSEESDSQNSIFPLDEPSQLDLDMVVGPGLPSLSNDETAIAVIMSILESDNGLNDAVDFNEMHWSL